jgi:hypothetical protein
MILTIVWNPHGFLLIDVIPQGSKFNARHYLSRILSPLPKFLLLIKMTQGEILSFTLRMPDLVVPKRLLSFWITIPYAKHFILLIRQI